MVCYHVCTKIEIGQVDGAHKKDYLPACLVVRTLIVSKKQKSIARRLADIYVHPTVLACYRPVTCQYSGVPVCLGCTCVPRDTGARTTPFAPTSR